MPLLLITLRFFFQMPLLSLMPRYAAVADAATRVFVSHAILRAVSAFDTL